MKKSLVIGSIGLFICIIVGPCINSKVNLNENISNNVFENFDCFIVARANNLGMIVSGPELVFRPFTPISTYKNITLILGYKVSEGSPPYYDYPSCGWVWTKGKNGVKSLSGNSLYGNLGIKRFWIYTPSGYFDEYLVYKGALNFSGIRIGGLLNFIFIGTASHVGIVKEFPRDN